MTATSTWSRELLALLLVLALGTAACVRITVEADPVPRAAVVDAGIQRIDGPDLAVTAIDFDPPLRPDGSVPADRATLLVVVENRGTAAADNVSIEARLLGAENSELLLSRSSTIERVVPGESRVVRFGDLPTVPLRSAYLLRVNIPPVPGKPNTASSQRSFNLRVSPAP